MMRKATVIVALALSAVLAYSIVSAVPSLAGPPDIPTIDVNVVNEQNNPVAVFDVDTPSFKSFRVISDFEPTGYPLHSSSGVWRSESAAPMMMR